MKFSMLAQEDRFTAPGGGGKGDWIIKLPDRKYSSVPLNEFMMRTLARESGIEVPEIRLVAVWPQVSEMLRDEPVMCTAIDASIQRGAAALRKR